MSTATTPIPFSAMRSREEQHSRGHQSRQESQPANATNVGDLERWASLIGGGAMALYGLGRFDLPGLMLGLVGGAFVQRGVSGRCQLYSALGVNTAEPRGAATSVPARQGVKVEKSITINRPVEELYRFWRNFENLPRFMRHLESVRTTQEQRSHWVAKGPMGRKVEWDAEIINDKPNELIAWRSLANADVDSAGSVHFQAAPVGRGTEMRVVLKYDPPGGKLGASIARLFGEAPEQLIKEDLRRFKQMMETGEIPTITGQPRGQCHK